MQSYLKTNWLRCNRYKIKTHSLHLNIRILEQTH